MLSFKSHLAAPDHSFELRDTVDWSVGCVRTLEQHADVVALAYDPVTSLLACGTTKGIVRMFGAPGVEMDVKLPQPASGQAGVKFLQIACNVSKLLCIDENNTLYLWDLSAPPGGSLKLEATVHFEDPVNSVVLSPSHTHAFLALESGKIKTFDLLCKKTSPYIIPNAWKLFEEKLAATGMALAKSDPVSQIPVDVATHPRNLNQLFVVYGGGVALVDLREKTTIREYQLVIPAGAPGGEGYSSPGLLTHRHPSVTSFTIHPSGHFFAVGYIDGSIAFWAVEDQDQPLLVRTLDDLDVNLVDGDALDEHFPSGDASQKRAPHRAREPIFKLAWSGFPNSSDPRGGETSLVILGGQLGGDANGVNVLWLPAFNPPEPPATANPSHGLHPHFRKAMRSSLDPVNAHFYATSGVTQDFLLIPKDTPHFGGTYGPADIIFIAEGEHGSRVVEAYEFPPLEFLAPPESEAQKLRMKLPPPPSAMESGQDDHDAAMEALTSDLESTLDSMQITHEPRKSDLPVSLWSGPNAVVRAELVAVEKAGYERLLEGSEHETLKLPMKGGVSVPDEDVLQDAKMTKFEPRRIIVTQNKDMTIRFLDASVQLLTPNGSPTLTTPFPNPLHALTIDVMAVLTSIPQTSSAFINQARIERVIFTTEALEVAVVLASGEVIVYRLHDDAQTDIKVGHLEEPFIHLGHVNVEKGLRFRPAFMINSSVPTSACTMCDVGFMAVAYTDGSLSVVNMRGPSTSLHVEGDTEHKSNHRHSLLNKSSGVDPVGSLIWIICSTRSDRAPRLRLIATRESGHTSTYTLSRSDHGSWPMSAPPKDSQIETVPHPLQTGTFIIDARTGAPCKADQNRFSIALQSGPPISSPTPSIKTRKSSEEGEGPQTFMIIAGAKGVRCFGDLGEEKVSKADWGSKAGRIMEVQIVGRNASYALVAFTESQDVLVYSLPALEHMHTFPIPFSSPPSASSSIPPSADITGDFLTFTPLDPSNENSPITAMHINTLFNIRRAYHVPLVSLTEGHAAGKPIPPQPQPVGLGPAGLFSGLAWLGGYVGQAEGPMTGEQVDALLAGPNRVIPERPPPRIASGSKYNEWQAGSRASNAAASAGRVQGDLYNRLHAAVSERGEMLGDLQESFNSLEEGSQSMVAQAKRLATQQTAKGWFSFK